jgi:hypothetical protein
MPVLHFCFAGSRPAMTMLVVAPPWTTALSINLRCTTPVLPIAIGRPSSPPLPPLPKAAVNARRQQTASAEIPIASDAQLRHTSRGFLPWRFSDAGPRVRGAAIMGRHPKTFTQPDSCAAASGCYSITSSARASSEAGTAIPSDFAVLRLITISNLVGCSTGRSDGFVPLRILPT